MTDVAGEGVAPEVDENGVDRTQIRAMLALTPEQRLRKLEDFVAFVLQMRKLNGISTRS